MAAHERELHRYAQATEDAAATREALKFLAWAFAKGDRLATELLYVPMQDNVVGAIQRLSGGRNQRMAAANRWWRDPTDPPGIASAVL